MSVGDDQQLFMRPAYFKSLALHFLFPAFLMLVVHWLDKIWQRPDLRPVPEYLEVSLLESPPVKKQTAAAKKSSPIEPAEKKPDPPKPKPAPPKVEEPPPPPIPPKAEVQPIVEKKTTPVEKSKAPTSAPVVPPTPTKKAPKKTPPPLPSLDQGMDELLEDEQETLDELKKEAKQSKNKSNQDKAATDARRTDEESVVGHYSALIRDRVEQSWLRPPSVRPGMEAILQVKLLPGGEVRDVEIIQSSGDQAFDYSALKAIREARILPVPEDNGLFNRYFRVIQFPFRPEDLQR